MATYTFRPVPAWGQAGQFARIGTQPSRAFMVTRPDGSPATVVQGGVTKPGYVDSDAQGMVQPFTTTDIPSVDVDFGLGKVRLDSLEAVTAGAASAAAASASASAAATSEDNAAASAASAAAATTGKVDKTDLYDGSNKVKTTKLPDLSGTYAARSGTVFGDAGRRYAAKLGVVRNDGTGWAFINDAGHRPTGFGAITVNSDNISIAYDADAVKVASLTATCDETLNAMGYDVGCSVGLSDVKLYFYRSSPFAIADYVQYNGTTWVSTNGVFTGLSYNGAGVLTLTHEDMGTTGDQAIMVTPRGSAAALAGGYGATTSQVTFYTGAWGSLTATTTATVSQHKAFVVRHGIRASRPAVDPTTVVAAFGNVWLSGLLEVAV